VHAASNHPDSRFFVPDEDVIHFIERYENNEFNVMFEEFNNNFSYNEINHAMKELKNNKSSGPDYLLNEFFTNCKTVLEPVLHKLLNRIFDIGYFPETWSDGYNIP
jgi:hypothetical protein